MLKQTGWILFALLCLGVGLYPSVYFMFDRHFGLLSSKSAGLLGSTAWNTAFYVHIVAGGLALFIGWIQFSKKIRINRPAIHRFIGKLYVTFVLLSATAGIYIGFYASEGIIPATGFIVLGLVWFYTTAMAYVTIRRGDAGRHRDLMIYSYAACFAAVTLRIWLPLLMVLFHRFSIAYPIVAWLAWVPNMVVAAMIIKKNRKTPRIA